LGRATTAEKNSQYPRNTAKLWKTTKTGGPSPRGNGFKTTEPRLGANQETYKARKPKTQSK